MLMRLLILMCFCTPASMVWVCAETSGQAPQARCDHGSALVGRRMAIFGGSAGENKWLNDLHFLDLGKCGRDVEPELPNPNSSAPPSPSHYPTHPLPSSLHSPNLLYSRLHGMDWTWGG